MAHSGHCFSPIEQNIPLLGIGQTIAEDQLVCAYIHVAIGTASCLGSQHIAVPDVQAHSFVGRDACSANRVLNPHMDRMLEDDPNGETALEYPLRLWTAHVGLHFDCGMLRESPGCIG